MPASNPKTREVVGQWIVPVEGFDLGRRRKSMADGESGVNAWLPQVASILVPAVPAARCARCGLCPLCPLRTVRS